MFTFIIKMLLIRFLCAQWNIVWATTSKHKLKNAAIINYKLLVISKVQVSAKKTLLQYLIVIDGKLEIMVVFFDFDKGSWTNQSTIKKVSHDYFNQPDVQSINCFIILHLPEL